jgi:ParB family chromosome partitioning protein
LGGSVTQDDIQELSIGILKDFQNHPFQVRDDEEMDELVESVRTQGIVTPLIVRPALQGGYEVIAGHRRKHAAGLAGMTTVPAIIRELNDKEAVDMMVDSNLQREHILPSEKAYAYRMKMEAVGHQGKEGGYSATTLGDTNSDSGRQVFRYIRLTYLIPQLLQAVDENKLSFIAGVNLSYLNEDRQQWIGEAFELLGKYPNTDQSMQIKKQSEDEKISPEWIQLLLIGEKKRKKSFVIKRNDIDKYFPPEYDDTQVMKVISQLLEEWSIHNKKE